MLVMRIVDNFLNREYFNKIQDYILHDIPWYKSKGISEEGSEGFYFTHTFYQNYAPCSDHIGILSDFINLIGPKAIIRLRAALYPRTQSLEWHGMHKDCPFEHNGCILYLNSCNGYTGFTGTCVESIENRALFFNPNEDHCSTSCTDQDLRAIIIMNYF